MMAAGYSRIALQYFGVNSERLSVSCLHVPGEEAIVCFSARREKWHALNKLVW